MPLTGHEREKQTRETIAAPSISLPVGSLTRSLSLSTPIGGVAALEKEAWLWRSETLNLHEAAFANSKKKHIKMILSLFAIQYFQSISLTATS